MSFVFIVCMLEIPTKELAEAEPVMLLNTQTAAHVGAVEGKCRNDEVPRRAYRSRRQIYIT